MGGLHSEGHLCVLIHVLVADACNMLYMNMNLLSNSVPAKQIGTLLLYGIRSWPHAFAGVGSSCNPDNRQDIFLKQ